MITIAIKLRKDKVNADGEAPLYFRLTKNRTSVYVSCGIRLKPHLWDEKNKRIKAGFPNSARFNAKLADDYAQAQARCLDLEKENRSLSAKLIKSKLEGSGTVSFYIVAEELIQKSVQSGKIGTADKNRSVVKKIKTFSPTLTLDQITVPFLISFENHLRSQYGNATNTIHANMKFIRRVVNEACQRDLMHLSNNPFLKYKLHTEKTSKSYLTEDELKLIADLQLPAGSKLDLHRKMFLFGVYSGGLRVSDLLLLKWNNFDGTHLHMTIRKTRSQHSVKLSETALKILQHVKEQHSGTERYVFRQLPVTLDEADPRQVDLSISRATAYYNKNLRIIANKAGIGRTISSHTARHSFGCLAIRRGIPLYHLQHIMKHSSPMITQQYAKIVNQDLDNAMDLLNQNIWPSGALSQNWTTNQSSALLHDSWIFIGFR
jgi:integrase